LIKERRYDEIGAPAKDIEIAVKMEAMVDKIINAVVDARIRDFGVEGIALAQEYHDEEHHLFQEKGPEDDQEGLLNQLSKGGGSELNLDKNDAEKEESEDKDEPLERALSRNSRVNVAEESKESTVSERVAAALDMISNLLGNQPTPTVETTLTEGKSEHALVPTAKEADKPKSVVSIYSTDVKDEQAKKSDLDEIMQANKTEVETKNGTEGKDTTLPR
jgi:hypothetical protein